MIGRAVTANRLADGAVVYLDGRGAWREDLAGLRIAADEADAEAMMAVAEQAVAAAEIVGPYLFEVAAEVGRTPRPVRLREVIRANGPTVRPDLGRQAGRG